MGHVPKESPLDLTLGSYPTPLVPLPFEAKDAGELWLKNDGVTATLYGGNKVRKLERVLGLALSKGKRRIVTIGAAGSHHVLATVLFGREHGLQTAALLTSQPHTRHAEDTLRAALGAGLHAVPVPRTLDVPVALAKLLQPSDHLLGPGAMGVEATLCYASAIGELAEQLQELRRAAPREIVVAVGSGGTAAGLLAGVVMHGLNTRIVGVCCSGSAVSRAVVLGQAALALRRAGRQVHIAALPRLFDLDRTQVAGGYGHPSDDPGPATALGKRAGLELDQTYTEKALTVAISRARSATFQQISGGGLGSRTWTLYWHTLSAVPLGALLGDAPLLCDLPRSLQQLLIPDARGP